jgi:thymidylate synthase (FAD)
MKDKKIDCLDKGFVRIVDFMGSDEAIVQAARVSYGEGTKTVSDDTNLIRYMLRNKHTSVFEQVVFKFHVKAPIFVFRQWHRHRTLSINELSARYSQMKDECYVPSVDRICEQSKDNKQGSGEQLDKKKAKGIVSLFEIGQEEIFEDYKRFIDSEVSRELARINLPVATYSEMYFTQNLHNLFHFLKLRMDGHAQFEIREYANALFELIKPIVPISCQAFDDYVLNSQTFSKEEMRLIKNSIAQNVDFTDSVLSKRELAEFKTKLGIGS